MLYFFLTILGITINLNIGGKCLAMEQRISVITLGVKDLEKSKEFYQSLGWQPSSASNDHLVAFQANGIIVCLYPEKLLAEDAMTDKVSQGFRGFTFAYNVANREEVDRILTEAEKSGAAIVKKAQDVFWGGYSGYFADPNGFLWEVAWNPHWPLSENGDVQLPD